MYNYEIIPHIHFSNVVTGFLDEDEYSISRNLSLNCFMPAHRQEDCPIYVLFELLWKKRVILIIKLLVEWVDSFTAIKQGLWDVNAKIISQRLDDLSAAWIVIRTVSNQKPTKITYTLTPYGKELGELVQDMVVWAGQRKKFILKS